MAEQLQCLGFDFDAPEKLERFFADHWERKRLVDLADGVYLRLDVTDAVSCWLSVDPETQALLDWDMHCASGVLLPCAFAERLSCDERGQSGLLRLTLDPGGEETDVTVACPALALWPEREGGAPGLVSLALYAESVSPAENDIESLTADPEDNTAAVTGRVLSAERCRNPWSGQDFWHVGLGCRGLTLDLYCAEEAFAGLPEAGILLSCRVFLTGLCEAGVITA